MLELALPAPTVRQRAEFHVGARARTPAAGTVPVIRPFREEVSAPSPRARHERTSQAALPRSATAHARRDPGQDPRPDHGESSYKGSRKLEGLKAVITGADSGIGRAVAIAFAREGADVLIAYLNEDEDARETQRLVEEAGRKAVLVAGDISAPAHCRAIIDRCVKELGGIDVLVFSSYVSGATIAVTGGKPIL
jgi:hypothetical protein